VLYLGRDQIDAGTTHLFDAGDREIGNTMLQDSSVQGIRSP
jgi:hypothetical protein